VRLSVGLFVCPNYSHVFRVCRPLANRLELHTLPGASSVPLPRTEDFLLTYLDLYSSCHMHIIHYSKKQIKNKPRFLSGVKNCQLLLSPSTVLAMYLFVG